MNTNIGTHKGYINSFQSGKVRVSCLPGEIRIKSNKILLIGKIRRK